MSKAPCKRTTHCWPTTPNIDGSCCIRLLEAKSLTRFKLCATTCNRVCKRTQHVTPNNIGSCWPTMLRSFARSLSYVKTDAKMSQRCWESLRTCWQGCANGCNKLRSQTMLSYVQTDRQLPALLGLAASVCT